jgi:hypothetical protein
MGGGPVDTMGIEGDGVVGAGGLLLPQPGISSDSTTVVARSEMKLYSAIILFGSPFGFWGVIRRDW